MAIVSISPFPGADLFSGRTNVIEPGGLEWESRWIDDWSLILTLDGNGRISFDSGDVPVAKRDLVLIAPEYAHRFCCAGKWDLLWVHFLMRPHLTPPSGWPEFLPGVRCSRLPGAEFLRARAALLETCQLDRRRPPNWHPLAIALLETALLRGCCGATREIQPADAWLFRAQKMLLDSTSDSVSMDRIASRCGMSRTKFYTAFKRLCGMSPRAYRELHQLRRAQLLLESTTLPIAEISRQVGISDPFYFSSRFRKFCGVAPSDYRLRLSSG